jgi:hypothetical protein
VNDENAVDKIGAGFFHISTHAIGSKEKVSLKILKNSLPLDEGKLEIDVVANGVCWISTHGSFPARINTSLL